MKKITFIFLVFITTIGQAQPITNLFSWTHEENGNPLNYRESDPDLFLNGFLAKAVFTNNVNGFPTYDFETNGDDNVLDYIYYGTSDEEPDDFLGFQYLKFDLVDGTEFWGFSSQSIFDDPVNEGEFTILEQDNSLYLPEVTIPSDATTLEIKLDIFAFNPTFPKEEYTIELTDGVDFYEFLAEKIETADGNVVGKTINKELTGIYSDLKGATVRLVVRHFNFDEDEEESAELICNNFEINVNVPLSSKTNEIKRLNVYPNPTNNVVNFTSSSLIYSVEVFNQLGQKVMVANKNSLLKNNINISSLNKGIYLLNFKGDDNKTKTVRVVKD